MAMSIRSEHEYAWFCEVCVATDPSAFEGETLWVFRDRVGKFVQGTVEVSFVRVMSWSLYCVCVGLEEVMNEPEPSLPKL